MNEPPATMGEAASPKAPIQMIDSHVHLFELEHIPHIAWMKPAGQLHAQHSILEYVVSTKPSSPEETTEPPARQLSGFIFVEVDYFNSPSATLQGWKLPLEEYSFIASISQGLIPKYVQYSSLVLGIILWAPIPHGAETMEEYEKELCKLHFDLDKKPNKRPYKVKGFRYLLRDAPQGTMLTADFISSLKWMGTRGYVFECTLDAKPSKTWQLKELTEMLRRVTRDVRRGDIVQVVLSHLGKPDFGFHTRQGTSASSTYYAEFLARIEKLSTFENLSIKLSGGFSQLPARLKHLPALPNDTTTISTTDESNEWVESVREEMAPWTRKIFKFFGMKRVIWGSNWPICNVMVGPEAWDLWQRVSEKLLEDEGDKGESAGVWGDNARRIYGIEDIGDDGKLPLPA